METLVGHLRYQLPQHDNNNNAKADNDSSIGSRSKATVSTKTAHSLLDFPFAGWIFSLQQQEPEPHRQASCWPVLLSQRMIDDELAWSTEQDDAQEQHGRLVRIHGYIRTTLTIGMPNGTTRLVPAIQVLENGLSCPMSDKATPTTLRSVLSTTAAAPSVLTLAQLAKLEHLQDPPRIMSFGGCVEAISPIITIDPRDPFCLVHLRQHTKRADYTVVVLLRKETVHLRPLLQPGRCIMFHDATRQAWRVPHVLARPRHTPPDRVLVVERPQQIAFSKYTSNNEQTEESSVVAVPSIKGRIVDIQFVRLSETFTAVNLVKLECGNKNDNTHTTRASEIFLFLTYFPMDTTLQASLQLGAEIVGFQLRCLEQEVAFEATLRSSIVVTKLAEGVANPLPVYSLKFTRKIKVSCWAAWRRLRIQNWLDHLLEETWERSLVDSIDKNVFCSGSPPVKAATHNPYHEFFECRRQPDQSSQEETASQLVDLDLLRDRAFSRVKLHLQNHPKTLEKSSTRGWSGSFSCECSAIADGCSPYTGGLLLECPFGQKGQSVRIVALKVRQVSVPVLLDKEMTQPGKSLVLIKPSQVIVSLFCLGSSTVRSEESNDMDLPHFESNKNGATAEIGCTRIIVVQGALFLCSIMLVGEIVEAFGLGRPSVAATFGIPPNEILPSIESILLPRSYQEPPIIDPIISALLVRKSVSFCKSRHGKYSGLCLTLSHFPHEVAVGQQISSLQSIEMKPCISIENDGRWKMKLVLEKAFGQACCAEMVDTAAAWWKLADNCLTCSIVTGGWDEFIGTSECEMTKTRCVRVLFKSSTIKRDEKRGYVRLRSSLDDFWCTLSSFSNKPAPGRGNPALALDFASGDNFFPGMLDRRPSRIGTSNTSRTNRAMGLLAKTPSGVYVGVSAFTISDLHEDLSLDLRQSNRCHLAPSLVREIRGARFLGVRFCVVFAECRKCFQKLTRPANSPKAASDASYLSRPMKTDANSNLSRPRKRRQQSLSCHNGCEASNYGIKWEISGTIDDGTAQARLYAEREAAICLLGVDQQSVDMIEDGVWTVEDGLLFSPTVPVKPNIRTAVESARAIARSKTRTQKGKLTRLDEATVLSHMSVASRAEYLFQSHCRRTRVRPATFYVRCKPLSDDMITVNHTEISVASMSGGPCMEGKVHAVHRNAVTYTLPTLALNLVELATPIV